LPALIPAVALVCLVASCSAVDAVEDTVEGIAGSAACSAIEAVGDDAVELAEGIASGESAEALRAKAMQLSVTLNGAAAAVASVSPDVGAQLQAAVDSFDQAIAADQDGPAAQTAAAALAAQIDEVEAGLNCGP